MEHARGAWSMQDAGAREGEVDKWDCAANGTICE